MARPWQAGTTHESGSLWGTSLREIRRTFARAANGSELLSNARADTWAKLPADARAGVN